MIKIFEFIDKAAQFKASGKVTPPDKSDDAKVNLEMAVRLKESKSESTDVNKPFNPFIFG